MKKLIVWLAILLPLIGSAQVSAPTQKIVATNVVRANAGSSGLDTLLVTNGPGVNGYVPVYNTTLKKSVFTSPSAFGTPVSFTAFGSTPNANGASVAGNAITLEPADATHPGGVTTGNQSWSGIKAITNGSISTYITPSGIQVLNGSVSGSIESGRFYFANNGFQLEVLPPTLSGSSKTVTFSNLSGTVALLQSPAFTGTPTAPTATAGTNTTQLATTAFVTTAVGGGSVWTRTGTTLIPTTAGDEVSVNTSTTGTAIIGSVSANNSVGVSGDAVSVTSNGTGVFGRTSTGTGVSGAATTSGVGVWGSSSSGIAGQFTTTTGEGIFASSGSSGIIGRFYNSTTAANILTINPASVVSTVPLTGTSATLSSTLTMSAATASTDAVWNASKNLVSNAITGTGNGVRATSPTLVTPNIGAATGTSLAIGAMSGTGNTVDLRNASANGQLRLGSSASAFYYDLGRENVGTGDFLIKGNQGSTQLTFDLSGNFAITGAVGTKASGTTWANPSDKRLKENIVPYTKGLKELLQINPTVWNFNKASGFYSKEKHVSPIAQDLREVMPEMVSEYRGKLGGKETNLLRIDASDFTMLLINAVKDQQAIIEKQDARILALEKMFLELKK